MNYQVGNLTFQLSLSLNRFGGGLEKKKKEK